MLRNLTGIVLFCLMYSSSCSDRNTVHDFFSKKSTVNLIDNSSYFLDKTGWIFIMKGETNGIKSISFEKSEADTLKHIIFALDENGNASEIIRFTKSFKQHYMRLDSRDTLFYYFLNDRDTIFVRGEYYYNFINFNLVGDQRKYYLLYKDSLNKIRGDNLPSLPNLTDEELKAFNRLYRN